MAGTVHLVVVTNATPLKYSWPDNLHPWLRNLYVSSFVWLVVTICFGRFQPTGYISIFTYPGNVPELTKRPAKRTKANSTQSSCVKRAKISTKKNDGTNEGENFINHVLWRSWEMHMVASVCLLLFYLLQLGKCNDTQSWTLYWNYETTLIITFYVSVIKWGLPSVLQMWPISISKIITMVSNYGITSLRRLVLLHISCILWLVTSYQHTGTTDSNDTCFIFLPAGNFVGEENEEPEQEDNGKSNDKDQPEMDDSGYF